MEKTCLSCGAPMTHGDSICSVCGTASPSDIPASAKGKKTLNHTLIAASLCGQKSTVGLYIGIIVGIIISVLLGAFVFPLFYLFIVNCLLELWRMIKTDTNRKNLQYYVITRPCLEKKISEQESSPNEYLLWFENRAGDLNVAFTAEKDFFDASEVGEEFYLVFASKEKTPCLCYKTSEWEYIENELPAAM